MVKKKASEPSTALVPSTTLFTISNELLSIQQKIQDAGGEIQEGDFESLEKWNATLEIKAENIAHILLKMAHEAEYYEALAAAAREQAEARSKTDKRLRAYLASAMAATGTKSIKQEGGLFSITLVDGRAQCKIEEPNKLPIELVEVVEVVKPKTNEIKKRLEAGETVPGASLEYGAPFLQIRS